MGQCVFQCLRKWWFEFSWTSSIQLCVSFIVNPTSVAVFLDICTSMNYLLSSETLLSKGLIEHFVIFNWSFPVTTVYWTFTFLFEFGFHEERRSSRSLSAWRRLQWQQVWQVTHFVVLSFQCSTISKPKYWNVWLSGPTFPKDHGNSQKV